MAPRYPRPVRSQPLQVGKVLSQVNPLLLPIEVAVQEEPARRQYMPAFTGPVPQGDQCGPRWHGDA